MYQLSSQQSKDVSPFSSLATGASSTFLGLGLFGDGKDCFLQQFSGFFFGITAGEVIGFFNESVDSISVCSKKMYLTARRRAKPRVITCSMSILAILKRMHERRKEFNISHSFTILVNLQYPNEDLHNNKDIL